MFYLPIQPAVFTCFFACRLYILFILTCLTSRAYPLFILLFLSPIHTRSYWHLWLFVFRCAQATNAGGRRPVTYPRSRPPLSHCIDKASLQKRPTLPVLPATGEAWASNGGSHRCRSGEPSTPRPIQRLRKRAAGLSRAIPPLILS